jgi:hypothetical protein
MKTAAYKTRDPLARSQGVGVMRGGPSRLRAERQRASAKAERRLGRRLAKAGDDDVRIAVGKTL